jgi:hypothetical protein
LRSFTEARFNHSLEVQGNVVDDSGQGSFNALRLVNFFSQCPKYHTQLEKVSLHSNTHTDPLAAVDQPAQLGRLPANWTTSPIDIDDLSVIVFINDNVGKGKVALHETSLMNI